MLPQNSGLSQPPAGLGGRPLGCPIILPSPTSWLPSAQRVASSQRLFEHSSAVWFRVFYTVPGLGCVCVVSCGGLCYVGACVECVTYGLNVVYRVRWYCVGLFCVWTVYCFLYYMKSVEFEGIKYGASKYEVLWVRSLGCL